LADGRGAHDPSHSYAGGDIAGAPCSGDGASGPGIGAEAACGTSHYSGRVRLLSEGPTPTGERYAIGNQTMMSWELRAWEVGEEVGGLSWVF
jgi:hypothetical protein